jgi:hypothetical protein
MVGKREKEKEQKGKRETVRKTGKREKMKRKR